MHISQIISLFGTQKKAAKAAQVTQPAVSEWLRSGQIPAPRQRLLLEAARKHKIKLEPADFFENFK